MKRLKKSTGLHVFFFFSAHEHKNIGIIGMVIWTWFIKKHSRHLPDSYGRNTKKISWKIACLEKRVSQNKKDVYMICLILFSKSSNLLPAFTSARAIGNLWSTCLEANILRLELSEKTCTFSFYCKYFGFKSMKNSFSTLKKCIFFLFFPWILGPRFFLKAIISTNKLLWPSSASFKVILSLQMSPPKVFIVRKFLNCMYTHLFYKQNFLYLPLYFCILLSSFLASSVNVFFGIASSIVNLCVLHFETSKASACFFLVLQLFLFAFQMLYRVENM